MSERMITLDDHHCLGAACKQCAIDHLHQVVNLLGAGTVDPQYLAKVVRNAATTLARYSPPEKRSRLPLWLQRILHGN